jgi:HlyD family secretion protein
MTKLNTHSFIPALIVVTTAALLGFAQVAQGQAAAPASSSGKPALSVSTVLPQTSTLPIKVSANGNIAAWQEASVGAESNGWRLADVRVNVGDVVKRGQVLASFAAEMVQAELAQSRAAVAEAEATLAEARANAVRARELIATGALSAQQIQQYLTAEGTAAARLDAQRAVARVQQLRLSQTQVLAPDNGVISARMATVGAVVPAGQELFRLIRQGRLEWRAEVAASELALVRPKQAAQLQPAGAPAVSGSVRMVGPTVDASTRNGLVFIDLGTTTAVKAGMFARGEIDIGEKAALTLPQGAVQQRDGFAWVYKVGADNRVAQAKVGVGRRSGDRIEITSGIDGNTRVVASGGAFLADGDLVRVVAATAPAPATPAAKPSK